MKTMKLKKILSEKKYKIKKESPGLSLGALNIVEIGKTMRNQHFPSRSGTLYVKVTKCSRRKEYSAV